MRAAIFRSHGTADVLEVVDDWPDSEPTSDQVVVRVVACGLNHLDVFVRRGMPGISVTLPHISGGDIAGVVERVGEDVRGIRPGDRVMLDPQIVLPDGRVVAMGEQLPGGLCELVSVSAKNVIVLPGKISLEQAAAIPVAYGTAYRMLLTRGAIRAGETVVILGASGGVGTASVQLSAMAGCRTIAVTRADAKVRALEALGADAVVVAPDSDFGIDLRRVVGRQGADVIVDYTGQATWPTTVRSTKAGGRILVCGATSGHLVQTDLRYVWARELTIVGSDGWSREDLEALVALVADGTVSPVIDRVLPLSKIAEGHRALEQREMVGKILVAPQV
jgi:alcohol dehydrogenase